MHLILINVFIINLDECNIECQLIKKKCLIAIYWPCLHKKKKALYHFNLIQLMACFCYHGIFRVSNLLVHVINQDDCERAKAKKGNYS